MPIITHNMAGRRFFLLWIRATWAGWLLGIPLIIVLALLAEAVGIGGSQTMVGAGMGTGTGLMQSRVIRGVVHKSAPWFWSSVVGLASPFLVADISKVAGWGLVYSLPVSVALGGIIAGGWQALILQPRLRQTWLWVVASALGWTLAAGAAGAADNLVRSHSVRGIWGAVLYLGIVVGGGLVLGLVTGICLAWMLRNEPATLQPQAPDTSMKLSTLISIVVVCTFAQQANAQDKWQIADEATLRLKPAAFSQLPKNIVFSLQKRNCTVPQTFSDSTPHNVIRGQFARRGQFDWAILCSRNRVSSILVFWNGSSKSVAEIAPSDDKDYLQTIDDTANIGFSRAINVVGKNHIFAHYLEYGGRKPPPINHQGINDAFVEKASLVHYFYRKRWLKLQGAD